MNPLNFAKHCLPSHKTNFLLCVKHFAVLELGWICPRCFSARVCYLVFYPCLQILQNSHPGKYLYLWPMGTQHQRTVDVYEEGAAEMSCYGLVTACIPHPPVTVGGRRQRSWEWSWVWGKKSKEYPLPSLCPQSQSSQKVIILVRQSFALVNPCWLLTCLSFVCFYNCLRNWVVPVAWPAHGYPDLPPWSVWRTWCHLCLFPVIRDLFWLL